MTLRHQDGLKGDVNGEEQSSSRDSSGDDSGIFGKIRMLLKRSRAHDIRVI